MREVGLFWLVLVFLLFPVAFADLNVSIDKSAPQITYNVSQTIVFTVNINNTGNTNYTGINVSDNYDTRYLKFLNSSVQPTFVNESGGFIFWQNITNFLLNETNTSVSFQLNFTASDNVSITTNLLNASVINNSGLVDCLLIVCDASTFSTFNVSITDIINHSNRKENISGADVLSVVQFSLLINNTGTANFSTVNLTDTFNSSVLQFLAANLTPNSINNTLGLLSWVNISSNFSNPLLFPNNSYIILVNFTILRNVTTTNRIDTLALSEGGTTSLSDANDTILASAPVPSVSIDKTLLTSNPSNKSSLVQFRINVSNSGSTNFTSINLSDRFNGSALGFFAANLTPNTASNDTGTLFWVNLTSNLSANGLLMPNQHFVIELNFTSLNASPMPTINNATVLTALDQFFNPASASDNANVTITGTPNATINKTRATPFVVNVSQLVRFVITINNSGETNLTNITLNDTFSGSLIGFVAANASFDAASNTSGNVHFPNILASPLLPGGSFSFELNFTAINTTVGQTGNITSNTIITQQILDTYNTTIPNLSSSDIVQIHHQPNLTVTKTLLTPNPINRTQQVRFLVLINNTGQTNITTLPLNDTFNASELQFIAANISPSTTLTGEVRYLNLANVTTLEPGQAIQLELNFTALHVGQTTNNATVHSIIDLNSNGLTPASRGDLESLNITDQPNASVNNVLLTLSPINISGIVSFMVNITNNGETNITSMTLLDVFDKSSLQFAVANLSANSSSNTTGQINYTNLSSTFGPIIPNQTILIQLNFTAIGIADNATNNATITNIVDVNGNTVAPKTASTGVEVQGAANLSVNKNVSGLARVNVSQLVSFIVIVNNTGQTNLTSLTLNDTFDGNYLLFETSNVTPSSSSNTTGQINFLNLTSTRALPPNQSIQIQVNFTARESTVNLTNNLTFNRANVTFALDEVGNSVIGLPLLSSASVRIDRQANLTITKSLLTVNPINRTQQVRFLVVLNNTGGTNITVLPLNDTFNASALSFIAANISPSTALTGEIRYLNLANVSVLAPGQAIQLELNFTAITESLNTTNNATTHALTDMNDHQLSSPSSRGDLELVQINGIANFSINKTRTTVFTTNRTELVRFQITINNTGETAITNLTLNDTYNGSLLGFLGANRTVDLANNASGSLHFPNVISTAIQPNQTLQIEINFSAVATTVGQPNNVTSNTIVVQSVTDENNNSLPSLSGLNSTDIVRINNRPNISIEKGLLTANPTNVSLLVRYRINITNNGETNLNNLSFNDTFNGSAIAFLASNTTFESASNASGFVVFANLVSDANPLMPNQTRVIDLNFTAIAPSLSTNNTAATALVIDTNANNPTTVTDSIALTINGIPNATVSKVLLSVSPVNISGRVSFLVTISNNGTTNITSLTILDSFDKSSLQYDLTNLTSTASSNLTGQINYTNLTTLTGALIPNQTVTIQLNFTAIGIADNATNNVTITNIVDLNNNPVPATSASTGVEVQGAANLSITKRLTSLNGTNVSQLVQFLITVNNTGQTNLTSITLNDTFDGSYLGFIGANVTPTSASNSTGRITFVNLTSGSALAVNQSVQIQLNFTAVASTVNLTNNVTTNLANITFTRDEVGNAVINAPFAIVTVRINNQPNVTTTKTRVTASPTNISSTIIFEVNVTNTGLTNLTSIPLTDSFNGSAMGFTEANVSVAAASNTTGIITITNLLGATEQLAPGAIRTVRFNFSAINPSINTANNATAGAVTDFNGYNPSNASASAIINVTGIINISASKTLVSENPTNVSLSIRYLINITNRGQHNLSTVAVTDTFNASAIRFVSSNVSVTSASNTTGNIFIANALTQALIPNASVIIALNFSAFNTSTINNNSVDLNAQDINSNNMTTFASAIVPNITLAINVTNLSISKIPSSAEENISDNISFRITINNTGNQPVTGILINDSVSANYLEFASSNVSISTNSSAGVIINNALSGLANLSPNSSFVLNLVFTARRNITNLSNTVAITLTDVNGMSANASTSHNVSIFAMNATSSAFSGNTTNFNNAPDITNVSNATLETGNATIIWSNGINANGADFNSNVLLGNGFVVVNSSFLNPTINSSANVTIKGVSCPIAVIAFAEGDFDNAEEIRQNGRDCEVAGVCTNKLCSAGVLTFTVSHFTGFAAGANSNLTIDSNSPQTQNNIITFNASYVNGSGAPITGSSCNLTFPNATTTPMINTSGSLFELNSTFGTAGTFNYNVTCIATGFTTLTATDSFTINSPSTASTGGGGGGGGRGGGSRLRQACEDGMDNDADGRIDLYDPGCWTAADTSETDELIAGTNITPSPISPLPPATRPPVFAPEPELNADMLAEESAPILASSTPSQRTSAPSPIGGSASSVLNPSPLKNGLLIMASIALLGIAGFAVFSYLQRSPLRPKRKRSK